MANEVILCDTNILIEFYKGSTTVVQQLSAIGQSNLAISVITQAELYFGALHKKELAMIKQHLRLVQCIDIDQPISRVFIELMEKYALSHKLSIPDALIAATSLTKGIKLYTFNVKDFKFIEGVQIYSA